MARVNNKTQCRNPYCVRSQEPRALRDGAGNSEAFEGLNTELEKAAYGLEKALAMVLQMILNFAVHAAGLRLLG